MGYKTIFAAFYTIPKIGKVTAAVFAESVKRTVTKHTVKFRVITLMTGKKLAFFILIKLISFHRTPPLMRELTVIQLKVKSTFLEQLTMCTRFNNTSVSHYKNYIRFFNR